jgi:hypothetical protein
MTTVSYSADGTAFARRRSIALSLRPLASPAGLIVLTVVILFARRPDQFAQPAMWIEDGFLTLRAFLESGARVLYQPLNGYLITASKLISYIAFSTSIRWAPEIEAALAVACTCAVTAAIAFSPTHLRWPFLCAVAVLLVPTGSEVFAVSAYTFWWAGLLLLLALLWDTDRGYTGWRIAFILIGGLSSPLIISLAPLFVVRAALTRRRGDYLAVALVALTAAIQSYAIHAEGFSANVAGSFDPLVVWMAVQKFVGGFVRFNALGPFILAALALAVWMLRGRLDRYFYCLVAAYAIVCASVVLRLTLGEFLPMSAGGEGVRYFFYPFVLLMWLLLWLAHDGGHLTRWPIMAVIAASIVLGLPHMQWRHDPIDWRAELRACADSDRYEIPIHYLGPAELAWRAKFTGAECRALLTTSLF